MDHSGLLPHFCDANKFPKLTWGGSLWETLLLCCNAEVDSIFHRLVSKGIVHSGISPLL